MLSTHIDLLNIAKQGLSTEYVSWTFWLCVFVCDYPHI